MNIDHWYTPEMATVYAHGPSSVFLKRKKVRRGGPVSLIQFSKAFLAVESSSYLPLSINQPLPGCRGHDIDEPRGIDDITTRHVDDADPTSGLAGGPV